MKRALGLCGICLFSSLLLVGATPKRVVILKVDGLGEDLLETFMRTTNPATGKSELPWITHLFGEGGLIFDNFYSRGISLSAPSWSVLDSGRHTVIRGNVEFDRFTGRPYDYLNFFPFYLNYARNKQVDMPGVEVLDEVGIPLFVDGFQSTQKYMSFQLFQRGVRWETLTEAIKRRFSSDAIIATVESAGVPSYNSLLQKQTEAEIDERISGPEVLYLDFYNGDVDHQGHATNQAEALLATCKQLDSLTGRIWTAIQKSPLANDTLLVMVSDHGMNNVAGVISQTYSITDFFSSAAGGGHHIVTDRPQMSDFKIKGLNPLTSRVISPSGQSFYLEGEANQYPTAWLDIDGNERTSVHLRNSDLNCIHILLKQLARNDLPAAQRQAAASYINLTIENHRAAWTQTANQLDEELTALSQAIADRKPEVKGLPIKPTRDVEVEGERRENRRLIRQLDKWESEHASYAAYLSHLKKLLAYHADGQAHTALKISDLIPEMALGENNTVGQIRNYVVGLSPSGLALNDQGGLDAARTFRHVNYPEALVRQRVRNMPQSQLPPRPIDFVAMALPDPAIGEHAYWLYKDETKQLVIRTDAKNLISVRPASGATEWHDEPWSAGLPLELYEDPALNVPGEDRSAWLSQPHSEQEWMQAIHRCRYSNGLIGIIEELSPVTDNVPGVSGMNPLMVRFAKRRRALVQPDFHIFATDHWNFNVRFPNPGGNHGGFFRISTHAVWMMAGTGIPVQHVTEPYDGLNFTSTVLSLLGRQAPMPDRVVKIQ